MKKTDVGIVLNISVSGTKEEPKVLADVMFKDGNVSAIDSQDEFLVVGNLVRYRTDKPSEGIRRATYILPEEELIVAELFDRLISKRNLLEASIQKRSTNYAQLDGERAEKELAIIKENQAKLIKQDERLGNARICIDDCLILTK